MVIITLMCTSPYTCVRVERGAGGTNCVGSGKNLKRHILSLVKHNICACVLWTDEKPKLKKTTKMDIIDDTDKQSKDISN